MERDDLTSKLGLLVSIQSSLVSQATNPGFEVVMNHTFSFISQSNFARICSTHKVGKFPRHFVLFERLVLETWRQEKHISVTPHRKRRKWSTSVESYELTSTMMKNSLVISFFKTEKSLLPTLTTSAKRLSCTPYPAQPNHTRAIKTSFIGHIQTHLLQSAWLSSFQTTSTKSQQSRICPQTRVNAYFWSYSRSCSLWQSRVTVLLTLWFSYSIAVYKYCTILDARCEYTAMHFGLSLCSSSALGCAGIL